MSRDRKGAAFVDVAVKVPIYHVWAALVAAFEGGSNYWYQDLSAYPLARFYRNGESPEADAAFEAFASTMSLTLRADGESETLTLDRAAIDRGLAIMANAYPYHFGMLIADSGDAGTGDALLQCSVLGSLVYG